MEKYYELSLGQKLSQVWKKERYCKKLKRKMSPSASIEIILNRIFEKSRRIKILESVYSKVKITKILDEVIGNDYFGNTQNRKRFYHLVTKITTQSHFECVYRSILSKGYNIKAISWLQEENLDESKSRKFLERINLHLLTYVVKPLVKHFYHPLKDFRSYEIKFIERRKWHSFQDKILNELLQHRFMIQDDTGVPRGVLRLYPKTDCDSLEYRPLICPVKYDSMAKAIFKRLSKTIHKLAMEISRIGSVSIFIAWKRYTRQTIGQQIYGIKLDIKDAFGNLNINKLCDIVKESKFSSKDKQFITSHIQNQYVTFHKKKYRWNHGLLQGDHLSSSLCNLIMSDFEKHHLSEFFKPGRFLHRMVDDYFFCSTEKSDIDLFHLKVKSMFQLNEAKTQRVDDNSGWEISYFGEVFNLKTRQVGKLYSFEKECSIRHKFKFWNNQQPILETHKHHIISRTLEFSYNNHCFKKIELTTKFNTEEKVLTNYFEGMVFIAFKFEAAAMAIRDYQQKAEDIPLLLIILETVVHKYSNIVFFKIKRCKGAYYLGNITFMLLKNIAYRAFILVLNKSYEFYKNVIGYIKDNSNLYLNLEKFEISPDNFTKLPKVFDNIRVSRRSKI